MSSSTLLEELYGENEMRNILLIISRDLSKLIKEKFFLVMRYISTLIQIFVYGVIISKIITFKNFYNYYLVGIYVILVFYVALNAGYDVLDEIRMGMLEYYLSLPISRGEYIVAKSISGGVLSTVYSIPILALISLLSDAFSPLKIIEILTLTFIFALSMSGIIIIISLQIKSPNISDIIYGVLVTLLLKLSTVYYPTAVMPSFYKYPALINPVSHITDLLRYIILGEGSYSIPPEIAFSAILFLAMASITFTTIIMERKVEGR
ncbi:MAG: ABC transporter permease [archaeon GB-1845-036]|nr:ABC transporter permease [Candidatus Culexmicrobium thermophilum]